METFRVFETANAMIYRGRMRQFLDGEEDPFALNLDQNPPFSIFLDLINYYYSFRRLELVLSRTYPIPMEPSQFYKTELDVRHKPFLG